MKLKNFHIVLLSVCVNILIGLMFLWILTNCWKVKSTPLPLMPRTRTEAIRLTLDYKKLLLDLNTTQHEVYKTRLVIVILDYYRRIGCNYAWNTPNHIKDIVDYCFKWYPIVADNRFVDKIDLPIWMISCCISESNLNPNLEYLNKNGTRDFGITQINNENIWWIRLDLPVELKSRDLKKDSETNICGRYLWVKDRREKKWGWCGISSKRGWTIYALLKEAK